MTILQYVQAVGGVVLVLYAVYLVVVRLRSAGPWGRKDRTQVDDLRLVIDLAARLRDKNQHQAVAVCEQLTHELLKPSVPPVEPSKP